MSATLDEFKLGTTFAYLAQVELPTLTGDWIAICHVRDAKGVKRGEINATLEVTEVGSTLYDLAIEQLAEVTKDWPEGVLYADIVFRNGATILPTQTWSFRAVKGQTHVF